MVVVGSLAALQILSVNYLGSTAGLVPLDAKQHAFCILWGFTAIPVSAFFKWLPNKVTEKIPVLVNEDQAVQDDKLMSAFNKQANSKAFK